MPEAALEHDLASTNLTAHGLRAPLAALAELAGVDAGVYVPDPLGEARAREALARDYLGRGARLAASDFILTASTSEAYAFLFSLTCDPGDSVLVPRPSYPLFGLLADLALVKLVDYRLAPEAGFGLDLSEIEAKLALGAKAIIVVHPNNPTGTYLPAEQMRALLELAASRGATVIADEVFFDHVIEGHRPSPSFAATAAPGLCCVLSGLSKVLALPQVKLGWIIVRGAPELVLEAKRRLAIISDTYLSVATPIQRALPRMLGHREAIRQELRARVRENLAALDRALAPLGEVGVVRREVPAGVVALVEVPRVCADRDWAARLAARGVGVHPGSFYEIEDRATLVVSLLLAPGAFAAAAAALAAGVEAISREG